MRDLLFKNITSSDRRKKIIISTDSVEKSGVRTKIVRHLICQAKEVEDKGQVKQPLPSLHIVKERNSKDQSQRFFCKIKGSIYTLSNGQLFLVTFVHSLRINLNMLSKETLGNKN